MEVTIVESESQKFVCSHTINIAGQNYTPTEGEYISQAWKAAVADGDVDADSKEKYEFRLSK